MAGPVQRIIWRIESILYGGYLAACRALGLERASAVTGAFFRAIGPMLGVSRTARINLSIAFPDSTPEWREKTLREFWEGMGRTFGEFANMHTMPVTGPDSRIELVGEEHLDAIRRSGRAAVFIGGHFANWEVLAMTGVRRGLDVAITYRAANNPWFDEQIKRERRRYGVETLTPKAGPRGAKELIEHLEAGRSVALMNDQKFNEGIPVPFFGLEAMTAPGPTRLAMRAGIPLVPTSVKRLPGVRFRVTVHPPIPIDESLPRAEAIQRAVEQVNRFIEDRIREAPADWFWVHRRFPKAVYLRPA